MNAKNAINAINAISIAITQFMKQTNYLTTPSSIN